MKKKFNRYILISILILVLVGIGIFGNHFSNSNSNLIHIFHQPDSYSRRYGYFTANICGTIDQHVEKVQYRLNDGQWQDLTQAGPRVPPPLFTLELRDKYLETGKNFVNLKAIPYSGSTSELNLVFDYDPTPIKLPIIQNWSDVDLDVQDGHWETFIKDGEWRVRPKIGSEDYDRVLAVSGAFAGGRRIETDLIFHVNKGDPYGFGVLPLWGGRPDDDGVLPSRGWNFSLVWYYSHYNGIGMEFSYKYGENSPAWVSAYRNIQIVPEVKYTLIIECWPEAGSDGKHICYKQRMKWFRSGETDNFDWLKLSDIEGSPLPESEYAVALVAHRTQVSYGPVKITKLEK
ncbi:hypothetical protein JW960_11315 [candidate division KSB1 bacterium]|nr:hypothetical protein [candidate division KSB1 bacterium]